MRRRMLALVALSTMAGAAVAADQPQDNRPGWNREAFAQMRAQRETERADDIALLIGLTPAQRPALDAFLKTMEPSRRMAGPAGGGDMPPPSPQQDTLLQRLDRMSQMVDRHDADAKRKIAAARAFYTSLTPDQQRRFDALDRLRRSHMGGRMIVHRMGGMGMRGMMRGPDGAPPPPPPGA